MLLPVSEKIEAIAGNAQTKDDELSNTLIHRKPVLVV